MAVDDDGKRDKLIQLFSYDTYFKLELLIKSIKIFHVNFFLKKKVVT